SEAGAALSSIGGGLPLLSVGSLAQGGDEDWNVPDSGDSGWYEPEAPDTQALPGPCEIDQIIPGMTPIRDVDASVSWIGTCSQMTLTAAVSGSPQTIASKEIDASSLLRFLNGATDVCELPGGSDLPGTAVNFGATGSEGATKTTDYTLPDLGEALIAAAESRPAAGSSVDPGQQIDFHAIGMVMMPALGIEKLSLYVDGVLLESVGNYSGSAQPVSCDPGRLIANLVAIDKYRVPDDPPLVIEACAEVLGFDGNKNRDCIEFYTGEVWEGTVDSTVSLVGLSRGGPSPCGDPTYVQGTAQIVVAEDGSATGSYDVTGCGVSEPHAEFSGTATDEDFRFPQLVVFTNGERIPKVSSTEAKATLTNCQCGGGGGARWVTTWNLTCKTCG
ncbi:MAG: hypothetical protein ACRDHM_09625, partial [Actinomycetota bacterium]